MNGLSVVIPSKNIQNLQADISAIRENGETCRIIWVDDYSDELIANPPISLKIPGGNFESVPGEKPFVFARNVNIGIKAAGTDDVLILNDDAMLKTPGGFSLLQRAAEEHPEYGIIAATTNVVGNLNQKPKGVGLREDPRMVCFVAVLVPRRTIDAVGLLDERYVGYGMDDDDYCLRVRNAGLKIGIHDGCFVDHGSLPSTYRGKGGPGGDFRPNLELFKQKWGMDNWGRPCKA